VSKGRAVGASTRVDTFWLATLRQAADAPPASRRQPLLAAGAVIGSVEPDFFNQIAVPTLPDGQAVLQRSAVAWHVHGELTFSLALVAQAMRAAGVAGAWRDEQLAVRDASGRRLGTVERAAVRPLGIATQAVHLMGWGPSGGPDSGIWVQQRAMSKSTEPGMWDTLMGGMVPAHDTLEDALARETWEEAGLRLTQLHGLRQGGSVALRRPAGNSGNGGYMVEHIDWFTSTLPEDVRPVNQDGEVSQFLLLSHADLLQKLQRNEFTTEAACVLVAALGLGD
jgi:8-oxo-dGTP pyrophosphatase MutT (NUDIX family)